MDRYLSPNDGMIATIVSPSFSGRLAMDNAAVTAAPEDIPQSIPSLVARSLAVAIASTDDTWMISSRRSVGTNAV